MVDKVQMISTNNILKNFVLAHDLKASEPISADDHLDPVLRPLLQRGVKKVSSIDSPKNS